jgi:hypothetical protein
MEERLVDGEREQEKIAGCVVKVRSLFPSIIRRNADMMAEMRIHDDVEKSQTGQAADLTKRLRRILYFVDRASRYNCC